MDAVLNRVSSPTFVGRADELAALEGALGRAAAGVPAFAFVAGESGVGKSRLVAEFESRAREAGARVLVGHCLELGGRAIPYAPAGRGAAPDRPRARRRACCRRPSAPPWPSMMPGFGDGSAAAATRRARAIRRACSRRCCSCSSASATSSRSCSCWRTCTGPTSRRATSSPSSSAAPTPAPLCVVVTYRSDELHRRHPLRPLLAELERTPGVERLGLERFNREEVGAQVSAILDEPAPQELADDVFARSEGNALYAEELLVASAQGCSDIPDTLRDLLLQRVERLPAVAQEVIRVVAVEHPMRHSLLAGHRPARARRPAPRASARRSPTRC